MRTVPPMPTSPERSPLSPAARRILTGNAVSAFGGGFTLPFLVVFLGEVRGLGTMAAGLLVAWLAVVGFALTAPVGTLVDRIGPRPVLMVALGLQAVALALFVVIDSLLGALLILGLLAVGRAGHYGPQSTLYARVSEPDQRQRVFGLHFMLLNLGLGAGGVVAALIVNPSKPGSFALLYGIDAATCLVYLAVIASLRGIGVGAVAAARPEDQRVGYRSVFADRTLVVLAVAATALLTFGYGQLEVGVPSYLTIVGGLPPSAVAVFYAANTAIIVVAQLFVIRLIAGRSRTRIAALVGLLWAACWAILGVAIGFPPTVAIAIACLAAIVFGIGETLWSPVAPALVNDLAPEHLRGRYNAVISWSWTVSGSLGPALAALMLGAGLAHAWTVIVVVGCLVCAVPLARLRGRLTPAQDGRAPQMASH